MARARGGTGGWRRRRRNNEYLEWNLKLRRVCHQLGIDYQNIDKPPPVYRKNHGHDTKQEEAHRNEFVAELEEYQRRNTALFEAVEPSLIITGAEYAADRRRIEGMVEGVLGDGAALVRWVRGFADVSMSQTQPHKLLFSSSSHSISSNKAATSLPSRSTLDGSMRSGC